MAGEVITMPEATIDGGAKPGSSATSQWTAIPDPATAGSTRVHSTTPSADGSPLAMPDGKRSTGA